MTTLEKIINEYDVSVVSAPVEVIDWSVRKLLETSAKEEVKKQLNKVNALRTKYGVIPFYIHYYHPAF